MKFSAYVKVVGWEWVLLTVASIALTYEVLTGFEFGALLMTSPWPAIGCAIIVGALFLIGFSRRAVAVGAVLLTLAFGVVLAAAAGAQLAVGDAAEDVPTRVNWLVAAVVVALCGVVPYLLARTRAGALVLVALTVAVSGVVEFMWGADHLWVLPIAAIGAVFVLLFFKNYQVAAREAMSARTVSFSAGMAFSLGAVLLAGALGCALWFGVIAPLNPPTVPFRPLQEVRALPIIPARGTSEVYLTPNLDMTSDETNELFRTTDDLRLDPNGIDWPARPQEEEAPQEAESGGVTGIDLDSLEEAFDLAARPQTIMPVMPVIALVVAAMALYFVSRRLWRARRLARFRALGPTGQVQAVYRFLIDRLGRVGYGLPEGMTPWEYAAHNAASLEAFDRRAGGTFQEVTDSYVAVFYGGCEATAEQVALCERYYRGLWKGTRDRLGALKYFFRSFRL